MKHLTKEEMHAQCIKEVKWTLLVTVVCALWHNIVGFALNGSGAYFLGMPAWFSVSVLGNIVIAIVGVEFLVKKVFVEFEYDEEKE